MLRTSARLGALGLANRAAALMLAGAVPTVTTAQQPATAAAATSLVFEGVTVVDVEQGKLLPAQRVVIVGNRIQAVGPTDQSSMPKGAQVVDARGKYLIPGLWDLHFHTGAYLPYLLFIANGVTGFRDAWAHVPLDMMRQWRREIVAGTRVGPPRQILSGVAIDECDGKSDSWAGHICVPPGDSAEARQLVAWLKAAGADMLKTYDLSGEIYRVIAAEARRVGLPFGGHLHALTATEASDLGATIVDHTDFSSGGVGEGCMNGESSTVETCQPIVERFRRNNTWSAMTLPRYIGPVAESIRKRRNEFTARFWRSDTTLRFDSWLDGLLAARDSLGNMHIAHRLNLQMLASTDNDLQEMWEHIPGFTVHAFLAVYVAEGLTPLEALQSATLNPAKMLHATDSLGTVAPGKLADLILLDADPLAAITNTTKIRAVVANGRYFDRAALDQLLVEVQVRGKLGFSSWSSGKQGTMMIETQP